MCLGWQATKESKLRTHVITDLAEARALAPAWSDLLGRSPSATAWASPASLLTWFDLTSNIAEPRIIAVWDGDRLTGLAAFSRIGLGRFSLLCTAGAGYGLYGDPLLGESAPSTAQALSDHLRDEVGAGALYLRRIRTDSVLLATLRESTGLTVRKLGAAEQISTVRFEEMSDVDEYLRSTAKKHEVPRLYRRLREQYDDVSYVAEDPDPLGAMRDMRRMQLRRFGFDLRMYATAENARLTDALVENMVASGDARVSSLIVEDRRVAVAFIPQTSTHAVWYAVAYEPALRRYGLGHIEPHEMLSHAHAQGIREVDLGDARFDYKRTWSNAGHSVVTASVTSDGPVGRVADEMRRVAIRVHRHRALDRIDDSGPHVV
jgi:CelD/BcsL family acetyltransferase involved in cellulose biosynthesis